MKRYIRLLHFLTVAALFLASATASAAMVSKMEMTDLVQNADKVFRGTVLSKEPGTVHAGGGELPTTIYTLRVDDALKGDFGSGKAATVIEVTMLGSMKDAAPTGKYQNLSSVMNVNPDLIVGREYVLFTTSPSAIGLSTTVGLNQGLFSVFNNAQGREMTANGLGNQGLFDGAVSYEELKFTINRHNR
jgi:hypothetical protein